MIWYYSKLAFRNVLKNRGYALVNITGFALGLSAFLLIILFVIDERSYDKFNIHHKRIFRVDTELKYGGAITSFAIAAPPLADAMRNDFPEVEDAVRIERVENIQLKKGIETIQEDRVFYADQSLFDVFSYKVLDGNTKKALADPGSIVIMKSVAMKYFGSTNATGNTLTIMNDNSIHTITAVLDDMPSQSHFHAEIILPLSARENSRITAFNQFTFNTYVLLKDMRDAEVLNSKLKQFLKKHLAENMNVEAFEEGGNYIRLTLTPLDNIHLHSNKQRELEANADISYVYIFTSIALSILALACINFVNLFTARSAERAKEVGVRKVLGSFRESIIIQFMLEAFVMILIAITLAVIVAIACIPIFNTLAGKNFELRFTTFLTLFPTIAIVTLVVSVVAGSYPAIFLSSFTPAKVLKGELSSGFRSNKLRNILVVIQFSIATILVVGAFVVYHQLNFIHSKNIGFNRDQVLIINNVSSMDDPVLLKKQVEDISGVINASLSGYLPTLAARWATNVSSEAHHGLLSEFWSIDADYIKR
ncbi:MAG: ABC transporter permease [Chryseolinea sp.]